MGRLKLHIQSSYGLLNYPGLACDYVRAGIAMYGVLSSPDDDTVWKPDLRPVLSLKSRVALIREVAAAHQTGARQKDAPALVKKIGKTTYIVRVHFSETSRETMIDKIKRMLKNEIEQM